MIISARLLLKFESYRAKLPGKEMEINLRGRDAALSDEMARRRCFTVTAGDEQTWRGRRTKESRAVERRSGRRSSGAERLLSVVASDSSRRSSTPFVTV